MPSHQAQPAASPIREDTDLQANLGSASASSSRAWRERQVQDPARGPASRTRGNLNRGADMELDSAGAESQTTALQHELISHREAETARRQAAFNVPDPPRGTRKRRTLQRRRPEANQ